MEQSEYLTAISPIQDMPYILRIRAEKRFLLIRDCEAHLERQQTRLGKKFRKVDAIEKYCAENGIGVATFYKWSDFYKEKGIEGLLPGYKPRGSKYHSSVMPIIHEILEKTELRKGYTNGFKELSSICEKRGLPIPNYATFIRLIRRESLSDLFLRSPKPPKTPVAEPELIQVQQEPPVSVKPYIPNEPGWMRIVNKKAFNIAIYKYNLIIPFLNPDLKLAQKRDLIMEMVARRHFALPGVEVRVNQASFYRMLSQF